MSAISLSPPCYANEETVREVEWEEKSRIRERKGKEAEKERKKELQRVSEKERRARRERENNERTDIKSQIDEEREK